MNAASTLNSMSKVVSMYKNKQIDLRKFRNCVMQMECMLDEQPEVYKEVFSMLSVMKKLAKNT